MKLSDPMLQRTRPLLALVSLALVVAACGEPGERESPPASPLPSPTATAAPTTLAPESPSPNLSALPSDPGGSPDLGRVSVALEVIVEGLDAPVGMAAVPGSDRLLVIEQAGRIREIRDGRLVERAVLDLGDRITSGGERGLLGIALQPDFPDDPRLYLNYTDRAGDTVVSELRMDERGTIDPATERVLFAIDQPYANHNGGALAFGPDGFLYVATGDGGSAGDPQGNGQRLDTLLGKILRIDVEAGIETPYTIPADNPFAADPAARPEIAHWGLRNPWRMAFDATTGDLWIGDVGQDRFEELNVARAGELGLNFGWNRMEGAACFEPAEGCDRDGLTPPVATYAQDRGCSVVGGPVYRGDRIDALAGAAVFADVCSGLVFAVPAAATGPVDPVVLIETGRRIASLGVDQDGELLAVDLGAGTLLRLVNGG